jgi:hypothetical protein
MVKKLMGNCWWVGKEEACHRLGSRAGLTGEIEKRASSPGLSWPLYFKHTQAGQEWMGICCRIPRRVPEGE